MRPIIPARDALASTDRVARNRCSAWQAAALALAEAKLRDQLAGARAARALRTFTALQMLPARRGLKRTH